jgi:hypothetical protein
LFPCQRRDSAWRQLDIRIDQQCQWRFDNLAPLFERPQLTGPSVGERLTRNDESASASRGACRLVCRLVVNDNDAADALGDQRTDCAADDRPLVARRNQRCDVVVSRLRIRCISIQPLGGAPRPPRREQNDEPQERRGQGGVGD